MPTGVYIAKKKDNTEYYRVSFTFKNKHISLGSFDDIKKAEKVYKNAVAIINDSSEYMVNPELRLITLHWQFHLTNSSPLLITVIMAYTSKLLYIFARNFFCIFCLWIMCLYSTRMICSIIPTTE